MVEENGVIMTKEKASVMQATRQELSRLDKVLQEIQSKLEEIKPLAAAERERVEAAKKAKFQLMDLDFNIRHTILEYSIEPSTITVFLKGRNGQKPTPILLPDLTKARDKQLRLEAILVTIENTTLEIHSGPANEELHAWLCGIDFTQLRGDTSYETGFDAVKSLSFPYPSRLSYLTLDRNTPDNDVELALKCDNLRTLDITFVDEKLVNQCNDLFPPKAIDQLRREYRLDGLLQVKKLERLRLRVRITNFVHSWAGRVGATCQKSLAAWFEAESDKQKRDRPVVVEVVGG